MSKSNSSNGQYSDSIALNIIGKISSPYKEKFAIPRQPGLVSAAKGKVTLLNQANNIDLVRGLDKFSHIWLLFVFHATKQQGWKPLVRPPRLGGNKKLGVLSTRSTFRPNPVGMSAVKLDKIEILQKNVVLQISGLDLLDNTPIIDIKPYIPYSDSIPNAQASFAQDEPQALFTVDFNDAVKITLQNLSNSHPELKDLIRQILAQDPRPAYKSLSHSDAGFDKKTYGMKLYQYNIKWRLISASKIEVFEIK